MRDFAERVAESKKLPGLLLGIKPLDPTIRIHDVTTPESVKLAVVCTVYPIVLRLGFVSHPKEPWKELSSIPDKQGRQLTEVA